MAPVSWGAYFVSWLVWLRYKSTFSTAEGVHRRIEQDRATSKATPPPHLYKSCIIEERHFAGCMIYDVAPKSELPNQARILYLHGGSYVFEIGALHWGAVAKLAEQLQAIVTVAIYPLAPEHTLTEICDAVQPIYDEMALPARDNTPFFVVGDSSGGSLALSLTQRALKVGHRAASRLVLISPPVDYSVDNPEIEDILPIDPLLDLPGLRECPQLVSVKDPKDPQLSPLFGDLDRLPPMLVFSGTAELYWPDIKLFVAKAQEKGREVDFVEGEGMMHAWPLVPYIPEAAGAMETIISWLEKAKS